MIVLRHKRGYDSIYEGLSRGSMWSQKWDLHPNYNLRGYRRSYEELI